MNQKNRVIIISLILLAFLTAPAMAAYGDNMVTNGDFEDGLSGWDVSTYGEASITAVKPSGNFYYSAYFYMVTTSDGANAELSQEVDLTYVDTLTFKTSDITFSGGATSSRLVVYVGNTAVASYSVAQIDDESTKSIDVSSYSGYQTISFYSYVGTGFTLKYYLDDVQAIDTSSVPTLNSISASPASTNIGQSVSFTASYTAGNPAGTYFYWNFGDGTSSETTATTTHTYNSVGTYTVTCYAVNSAGFSNSKTTTVTILPAKPSVSFTASPTSGSAPLEVLFSSEIVGVGITSVQWNFGDGGTSTNYNPSHRYESNGVYTVTLTVVGEGGTTTETRTEFITVADQYIRWDKDTYTSGQDTSATISWSLINPNFASSSYEIRIFPYTAAGGIGQQVGSSYSISTATGSTTIGLTGISAGEYIAIIYIGGQQTTLSDTANVQTLAKLTVDLAANNLVWTNSTTVTLYQNGVQVDSVTTTTGQAVFEDIITGNYNLIATTEGYNQQTLSVTVTQDTTVTMDFVKGSSQGSTSGSGSGQSYAATFVTFRVVDEATGKPLSGATVTVVGKEATNPLEWIGQLFGASWGADILGTTQTGTSDQSGVVTFAMFPTVLYAVTIVYEGETYNLNFQQSQLAGEYPLKIPVTQVQSETSSQAITTTVTTQDGGIILVNYADTSQTTQSINIQILKQEIGSENYTVINSLDIVGSQTQQSFTMTDYSGENYRVVITAESSEFGTVERTYGISFPGPLVKIGSIPEGLYIWICVFGLLILGAIGTRTTSTITSILVVFVGWLMYFMGWMFQLGVVAPLALGLATGLAVIIYMVKH